MKRKIYQIEEGKEEPILAYEEETDERDNVTYFKVHMIEPLIENYKKYNSRNLVTEERELEDGVEVAKYTFEYNEKGDIVTNKVYVNGELFQEINTTFSDDGSEMITLQNGEEMGKTIVKGDSKNFTETTYEWGQITRTIYTEYNKHDLISKETIYNDENSLMATIKEYFTKENVLIKVEEFDSENTLIHDINYELDGNHIVSYVYRGHGYDHKATFEFDERGNVINKKVESKNHHDSFHVRVFDENNYLIEEEGIDDAVFSSRNHITESYHEYFANPYFYFKHEYEK